MIGEPLPREEIQGLLCDPGVPGEASQDDIKKAYWKLGHKYHPDVSKEKDAEERFKKIKAFREVVPPHS